MMTASAAAALLLLLTVPAMSQDTMTVVIDSVPVRVGLMADTEDAVRWKVLAKDGIDSKNTLREQSRTNLNDANRLPYEFQRVEVAGMLDTDDTAEKLPDIFDKQLKLSNRNEDIPTRNFLMNKIKSYFSGFKDLREAMSDTQGYPTARAEKIIAELKDVKINELFAHSWGTEAVYLGILSGHIIPPKKLFIVGVPEANEEKWIMLAKYTGIEVHVVGFEWDKAKIAGDIAGNFKSGLPKDTAGLEKLWSERCAARSGSVRACADPDKFIRTKFDYDIHVRPPDVPKDKFIKGRLTSLDHDRMLYYTHLVNRKLLYKTVAQLEAPQLKLVKAEENRILAEAMVEARTLIAAAKAQAEIEEDRKKALRIEKEQARFHELLREQMGEQQRIRDAQEVTRRALQQAPPVARGVSVTSFLSMLPEVKDFAVESCRWPGQIVPTEAITRPYENIHFSPPVDDPEADRLSAGLGNCERRLFRRLIEVIRLGRGRGITLQWIKDTVRSYNSPTASNEDRRTVSPPPELPPSGGRECFIDSNGNRACTVD